MLRRSTAQLAFSRTPIRRAGAKPHPYMDDPAHAPSADEVTGMFGKPWNGDRKLLRAIDFCWVHNRLSQLGRENYVAAWVFYWPATFGLLWVAPNMAMWGDGKPPRTPDWNQKTAGQLPSNFQKTVVA